MDFKMEAARNSSMFSRSSFLGLIAKDPSIETQFPPCDWLVQLHLKITFIFYLN